MLKKTGIFILMYVILFFTACSSERDTSMVGIDIQNISSSIGAVDGNVNDFESQSFSYTLTLSNNEAADITVVSVSPVLSEEFLERVKHEDTTLKVDKIISGGSSLEVNGEILFDAKGLTKEEIIKLQPFVKEVRVLEERTIRNSF